MANSTVNIPLFTTLNDKGIQDAIKGIRSLGGELEKLGKKALGAYTGFEMLRKSIGFIGSSVNAARDLQRNMAGMETIFGSNTAQMEAFVKTSETMGMSQAQAAKATAFLGSVFKQTGIPMQQVMNQTKQMVSLGADLASTYGYSVEEALTAMTATFRGEYDPIEKFGVAMKQQQVNAELAAMGLGKLKGQALIAAQQQVRYQMILSKTTDAQGAFARQSGNLFEQQQVLQAVWTDMQATLGEALTPAIGSLLSAMQPIVSNIGPSLVNVFNGLNSIILAVVPHLSTLGSDIGKLFTGIGDTITFFAPLVEGFISFLVSNLPAVLTFFAAFKVSSFIVQAAIAFERLATAIAAAKTEQALFDIALGALNPTALAIGLGIIAAGFVGIQDAANKAKNAVNGVSNSLDVLDPTGGGKITLNGLMGAKSSTFGFRKVIPGSPETYNNPRPGTAATWVSSSGKWVTSTWNGSSWSTPKPIVYNDPNTQDDAAAKKAAAKAAAAARKAAAEATKIQKEVVNASNAMKKQITDALKQAVTDATKAFDDIKSAAMSFIGSFNTTMQGFAKAFDAPTNMGAFETDTVNAFKNIADQALAAKEAALIDDSTLSKLQEAAAKEAVIIQGISKQRDVLTEKIAIARGIVANVYSFGNIATALQSITKTVTETSTKIIDGVSVTLSRAVESAKASDLVDEYKRILDKTKAFATNLKALKTAGLDSGLFKQIVDAGVDSGGATAAAIIAGGSDTISELNGLFADLQTAGSDIAATTTDVMYAAGQDITNGFIGGLISESENLRKQAAQLADVFSNSFTNTLLAGINAAVAAAKAAMESAQARLNTVNPVTADYTDYINGATAGLTGAALQKQLNMLSGSDVSAPGSFMNTLGYMSASGPVAQTPPSTPVVLQVDGKTLATSLLTYERVNGAIYVRAQ